MALRQSFAVHKVNVATKDRRQFRAHRKIGVQSLFGPRREPHENVDITSGSEVAAQNRTKKRELRNMPLLAERLYFPL